MSMNLRKGTLVACANRVVLLVFACLFVVGCGPSMPKTVKVSGKVTYGGGAWPKPGRISFPCTQPAEGFPNHPGSAEFDTSGNFVAMSYAPGDGLQPGKYVVNVECWEVPPSMDGTAPAKSYVPADFRHEFEVKTTDRTLVLNIDVPKPKP